MKNENLKKRGFIQAPLSKKIKSGAGFTLLEILLYAAIVGAVLIFISGFIIDIIDSKTKNDTILEVQNNGALAMERITQTTRNAQSIVDPGAGSSDSLTLDIDGSIQTMFFLNENRLYIWEDLLFTTPQPLTSLKVEVSNLNFTNLSPDADNQIIQINFDVKHKGIGQKYQSQISMQNSAQVRSQQ